MSSPSCGQRTVPDANGHNCARLRSSVVFPVPGRAGDHQAIRRGPAARRAGRQAVPAGVRTSTSVELERAVDAGLGRQRR